MDKIYRRPTQVSGTPKKKKDEKARKRNVIVNFRVTQIEKELIDARIALSGLDKSMFFIESCLYQTVLVKGNIKSFSAIREEVAHIKKYFEDGYKLEDMEPEQLMSMKTILEIIDGFTF